MAMRLPFSSIGIHRCTMGQQMNQITHGMAHLALERLPPEILWEVLRHLNNHYDIRAFLTAYPQFQRQVLVVNLNTSKDLFFDFKDSTTVTRVPLRRSQFLFTLINSRPPDEFRYSRNLHRLLQAPRSTFIYSKVPWFFKNSGDYLSALHTLECKGVKVISRVSRDCVEPLQESDDLSALKIGAQHDQTGPLRNVRLTSPLITGFYDLNLGQGLESLEIELPRSDVPIVFLNATLPFTLKQFKIMYHGDLPCFSNFRFRSKVYHRKMVSCHFSLIDLDKEKGIRDFEDEREFVEWKLQAWRKDQVLESFTEQLRSCELVGGGQLISNAMRFLPMQLLKVLIINQSTPIRVPPVSSRIRHPVFFNLQVFQFHATGPGIEVPKLKILGRTLRNIYLRSNAPGFSFESALSYLRLGESIRDLRIHCTHKPGWPVVSISGHLLRRFQNLKRLELCGISAPFVEDDGPPMGLPRLEHLRLELVKALPHGCEESRAVKRRYLSDTLTLQAFTAAPLKTLEVSQCHEEQQWERLNMSCSVVPNLFTVDRSFKHVVLCGSELVDRSTDRFDVAVGLDGRPLFSGLDEFGEFV